MICFLLKAGINTDYIWVYSALPTIFPKEVFIMRTRLLFSFLLVCCTAIVFPQAKPRLGILPFVGGAGVDGETIATLFSFQPEILDAFTVVPRTSAVNAVLAEQHFQMTGYTDSDTIADIGRMLGADYVISGSIRSIGNRRLVIATIINIKTFEQMAGYYRTYRNIAEARNFLPAMSKALVNAAVGRDTSSLQSLAIAPFSIIG